MTSQVRDNWRERRMKPISPRLVEGDEEEDVEEDSAEDVRPVVGHEGHEVDRNHGLTREQKGVSLAIRS